MVNCAYPTFICADRQPASLFTRLLGIQANSSSRDQLDLDGSADTQRDSLDDWVEQMLILHRRYGMKLLGGCCGTDERYLSGIIEGLPKSGSRNPDRLCHYDTAFQGRRQNTSRRRVHSHVESGITTASDV